MKKVGVKMLRRDKWKVEENLVLKEEKLYVPKNKKLRIEIIQLHYDVLTVGYGERWKITKLVTRNYWWLEVTKDIEKYVNRYNICQRIKNRIEIPARKLKLSKVPKKPWLY